MDYSQLTPAQQYQIVQGRLAQLQQQHLLTSVNLVGAIAAGETPQAETMAKQLAQWELAISAVQKMLDEMPAPTPDPDGTGIASRRPPRVRV